jgi:hypothetical protein
MAPELAGRVAPAGPHGAAVMMSIERAARSLCRQEEIPEDRWAEWPANSLSMAGRQLRFAVIDLLIALPWPFRAIGRAKLERTP